jgi:hypothetical protein
VLSVVRVATVARQWHGKYIYVETNPDTAIEEPCFLRGPCQEVISEKKFRAKSVDSQAMKR